MLDQTDYHSVRNLARELVASMETLCCGCRDADGRTMVDEQRMRAAAEAALAKIATLVMTSNRQSED